MGKWFIRVLFSNGDTVSTRINGTRAEVEEYYAKGKVFNLGSRCDDMQTVVQIMELWPVCEDIK